MIFISINNKLFKMGLKRISGLFAALYIRELVNSWDFFFDVTNRLKGSTMIDEDYILTFVYVIHIIILLPENSLKK